MQPTMTIEQLAALPICKVCDTQGSQLPHLCNECGRHRTWPDDPDDAKQHANPTCFACSVLAAQVRDLQNGLQGPPRDTTPAVDAAMEAWKEGEPEGRPSVDLIPSEGNWSRMVTMSQQLAGSNLVRARGFNTQPDVLMVLLAAHDLGVASTLAIQKFHVIDGKVSMSAELMAALVVRDGHEIWVEQSDDQVAIAGGRRKGSEKASSSVFTIEDARRAQLLEKKNWKHYPKAMLWARAVSALCRMAFPDVLCGLTYTPDELGAIEDGEGNVLDVAGEEVTRLTDEERDAIKARARALPEHLTNALNAKWRQWTAAGNLHRLNDLDVRDLPKIESLFEEFEGRAEAEADSVCATCGFTDHEHEVGCPDDPDPDVNSTTGRTEALTPDLSAFSDEPFTEAN